MEAPHYTLIKSARLIQSAGRSPLNCSILIRNRTESSPSEIVEAGDLRVDGEITERMTYYNARSHYVCHGFTDLWAQTCQPGFMSYETLETAAAAAKAGGFTAIHAAPFTNPSSDDPLVIKYIKDNSAGLPCRILPGVCMSKANSQKEPADIRALMKAGGASVSVPGVLNTGLLMSAMELCAAEGYPLIIKCGALDALPGFCGALYHGMASSLFKTEGIPSWRQDVATAAVLVMAEASGCPVHLTNVSTAASVELIREAKARGVAVSADTCPQYFIFSQADLPLYGVNLKLMPPVSTDADVAAVREGIRDGTIDAISSDHTPRSAKAKEGGFAGAAFGMTGLQTLFQASYTNLVATDIINLTRLITMLTAAPAAVLGERADAVVGTPANLTVFSTGSYKIFGKAENKSRSENSPFFGMPLAGSVIDTFYDGRL